MDKYERLSEILRAILKKCVLQDGFELCASAPAGGKVHLIDLTEDQISLLYCDFTREMAPMLAKK